MADENATPAAPTMVEVSATGRDDLAAWGFLDLLRTPEDKILTQRLGGDYENYRELLRDDQVASCLQQRRLALVSREVQVTPASEDAIDVEAAEFMREQIRMLEWDRICGKMHFGTFYGYAVAELLYRVGPGRIEIADVRVRKQSRFKFDRDNRLRLVTASTPLAGELMPDRKFWTFTAGGEHDDDPYGIGLAHAVYWPVYFKRHGIKFWSIYLEKFGAPTAVAKLPAAKADDAAFRARVLEVLRALQTDSGVIVPDGLSIELLEAVRQSGGDYDRLCARMDGAIAKAILSQTMTTDNGSSRSQAEVHFSVRREVVAGDSSLLAASFNRGPVRWLTEWNFPGARPPLIAWNLDDQPDLKALAERDKVLSEIGYRVTQEYVQDTYGVEVDPVAGPRPGPGAPGGAPSAGRFDPVAFGDADHDDLPASFADVGPARIQNRADQAALLDVAAQMAASYQAILGARVQGLLDLLEQTGDLLQFRERMTEILEGDPPQDVIELLTNTGFTARLLGRLREER